MAEQGMSAAMPGIDAVLSRAGGQLTHMQEGLRRMRGAEGSASSADGLVEVSVDAFGNPAALRLAPGAASLRADELGTRIVETCHAAARELAAEHARILATLADDAGLAADSVPGKKGSAYTATPVAGLGSEGGR